MLVWLEQLKKLKESSQEEESLEMDILCYQAQKKHDQIQIIIRIVCTENNRKLCLYFLFITIYNVKRNNFLYNKVVR